MNMGTGRILPTAEPFLFPGGPVGCLLIHGFTGTPKEMRSLGEHLAAAGHTVLGVRLPGHATHQTDLNRTCWEDWAACVEDGWYQLSCTLQQIFLIGLSMGGVLALFHAAKFPVSGVVALSTPHHLPSDPRLPFAEFLSHIQPTVAKGPPDWKDVEAARTHIDYPAYPTRAIAELRDLLAAMRAGLPQVTAPTLLINSKDDLSARQEEHHADLILKALGSSRKSVYWIEGSGHVITRDARRSDVWKKTAEFIDLYSRAVGEGHS